jgi:hypothetical protein
METHTKIYPIGVEGSHDEKGKITLRQSFGIHPFEIPKKKG